MQINLLPRWHLNGTPLNFELEKYSVKSDGTMLSINNIVYSDEGDYTCQFHQNGGVFEAPAVTLRVVGESSTSLTTSVLLVG